MPTVLVSRAHHYAELAISSQVVVQTVASIKFLAATVHDRPVTKFAKTKKHENDIVK